MNKISRAHIRKMIIEALGDRGDLPKKYQYRIGMRGPEDLPYGNVTDSKRPDDFSYIPDDAFIVRNDSHEIADILYNAIKIGQKIDYSGLLQIANKSAGEDVSAHVEPALQLLVDDGIFERTFDNFYVRVV